jgi:hypothetical protein
MGSPKSRSGKRSITKKRRQLKFAFLFDRSSGTEIHKTFKKAGQSTVLHDDVFPSDTPDVRWIAECGTRRYFAVTGDRNIQSNANERAAIISAKIGAFAFSGGNWGTKTKIQALEKGMTKILKLAASQTKPFIAQISKNGQVRVWYDHTGTNLLSNTRRKKR